MPVLLSAGKKTGQLKTDVFYKILPLENYAQQNKKGLVLNTFLGSLLFFEKF
jgi:hypothetical protein